MKITLAIPTNRGVRPKTVGSLLEMVNYSIQRDFHIVIAERGYTVAENRNYAVVQAMKNGSDYLLFVDDDMVFPEDTLERLLAHNREVVGVASNSRVLPLRTTVGLMDSDGKYKSPNDYPAFELELPKELFKAYFVGGGVLLIDMKVFEKIKKPYFSFKANEDGMVTEGEDGRFCEQVKEAGMDVYCDPTIEIGHLGEYQY